jgi:hypothetical protein
VDKPQEGPPTGKPVTIRVIGDDFRVARRAEPDDAGHDPDRARAW